VNQKLSRDAFQYYVSLNEQRSYDAVAAHFGVNKRTVTRTAKREDWQGRLDSIEQDARVKSDAKLGDALADVRERHIKTLKVMNMRAVEALRSYPLTNGMEAMRAAEMSIKLERLIHGEPTDRSAISVEEVIKREYERWLKPAGVEDGDGGD
jgi:hypothetical protein